MHYGYEEDQKALFMEALDKPQGMLLITGPTGSGENRIVIYRFKYFQILKAPIFLLPKTR